MAGVLLALGVYILLKFTLRPPEVATARTSPHGSKFLSPFGLVAGFVDASGGGWGPVATPALLTAGKTAPRTVIGSVDTSEFLVALAAITVYLFIAGVWIAAVAIAVARVRSGALPREAVSEDAEPSRT